MSERQEQPLVFDVEGDKVVGILHHPDAAPRIGFVMFAAGGPQYRVGCCRQLLVWARQFAAAGMAVLRFDYRGYGDSSGEFRGFEHVDDDIESAIDQLMMHYPALEEVVLWGGCSAASAIMMYAWRDRRVRRIITLNPWAHTEASEARMQVKHYYLQRITEKAFWVKLLSGKLDLAGSAQSFIDALRKLRTSQPNTQSQTAEADDWPADADFVERMRAGLQRFEGEMLLLLSGRSMAGREFDEIVALSPAWQKTVAGSRITRMELPEANHTFSTHESQDAAFTATLDWLTSHSSD